MSYKINGTVVIDNSRNVCAVGVEADTVTASTCLVAPAGTTAGRPAASTGQLYYDTDEGSLVAYSGVDWVSVGGAASFRFDSGTTDGCYVNKSYSFKTASLPPTYNACATLPAPISAFSGLRRSANSNNCFTEESWNGRADNTILGGDGSVSYTQAGIIEYSVSNPTPSWTPPMSLGLQHNIYLRNGCTYVVPDGETFGFYQKCTVTCCANNCLMMFCGPCCAQRFCANTVSGALAPFVAGGDDPNGGYYGVGCYTDRKMSLAPSTLIPYSSLVCGKCPAYVIPSTSQEMAFLSRFECYGCNYQLCGNNSIISRSMRCQGKAVSRFGPTGASCPTCAPCMLCCGSYVTNGEISNVEAWFNTTGKLATTVGGGCCGCFRMHIFTHQYTCICNGPRSYAYTDPNNTTYVGLCWQSLGTTCLTWSPTCCLPRSSFAEVMKINNTTGAVELYLPCRNTTVAEQCAFACLQNEGAPFFMGCESARWYTNESVTFPDGGLCVRHIQLGQTSNCNGLTGRFEITNTLYCCTMEPICSQKYSVSTCNSNITSCLFRAYGVAWDEDTCTALFSWSAGCLANNLVSNCGNGLARLQINPTAQTVACLELVGQTCVGANFSAFHGFGNLNVSCYNCTGCGCRYYTSGTHHNKRGDWLFVPHDCFDCAGGVACCLTQTAYLIPKERWTDWSGHFSTKVPSCAYLTDMSTCFVPCLCQVQNEPWRLVCWQLICSSTCCMTWTCAGEVMYYSMYPVPGIAESGLQLCKCITFDDAMQWINKPCSGYTKCLRGGGTTESVV